MYCTIGIYVLYYRYRPSLLCDLKARFPLLPTYSSISIYLNILYPALLMVIVNCEYMRDREVMHKCVHWDMACEATLPNFRTQAHVSQSQVSKFKLKIQQKETAFACYRTFLPMLWSWHMQARPLSLLHIFQQHNLTTGGYSTVQHHSEVFIAITTVLYFVWADTLENQGWEFAHWFFEQFAHFLWVKEQFTGEKEHFSPVALLSWATWANRSWSLFCK